MKKVVSLVLALVMVLSAVSALAEAAFTPAESYDPGERAFDGGVINLVPAAGGSGNTVSSDVYAGEEGKDYTDEKVYTYNAYMGALTSQSNWDPLSWETSDDSDILGMLVSSFYAFKLNSDKTGYSIVPEMAADYPVDVTAEYVGQYGIEEGEEAKAWRIALRQDIKWNDGTPINADDFVYSMQQQLNPKMLNRRADSWYDGTFSIVNAKNYLYAGGATYDLITGSEGPDADLYVDMYGFWNLKGCVDADGNECPQYVSINDEVKYRDVGVTDENDPEAWVSGKYIYDNYLAAGQKYEAYATQYVYTKNVPMTWNLYTGAEEEGTKLFVDMWGFWNLKGMKDADGNECPQYVAIDNEVTYRDEGITDENDLEAWISAKAIYDNYLADGMPYAAYATQYVYFQTVAEPVTWDDVGFKKVDDYTIDFIVEKPVSEPAYYVPYSLSDFLVKKDLYESCKKFFLNGAEVATEEEADQVTSNYCHSLETTASYGPYMLTTFQLDKEWAVSRNENWYGYYDGRHLGQYQMDNYVSTVMTEHATEMLAFQKGEIDSVGLQNEDMDKYAASAYIHYTPQSYTTKVTWNTDYSKLLERGTGSQILVIDEFRKGFAFALDAAEFASAYTAAGTAGFGMLNYQYCYDPFTGALYRDSEPAKKALVELFEMTYGEGGEYADLDEAYEAMTGYDMEKAQALMAVAADKAIEANVWDGESAITIEIRVYQSDEIYVKMFNYFNAQLQEAVKGSKLEGKVSMTMTVDADYYETNYSGGADMIFTTWGGASMAPFQLLANCYTDGADGSGNQMEYGYDTTKIMLTLDCGEKGVVTDTLRNWALWCNNATDEVPVIYEAIGAFADYAYSTRCEVFAACEHCFMNWFPTTALYYRNSASLLSQKINYPVDTYLTLIGYGGLEFYTFNYDDAEWAEYIAGNELVY